MNFNILKNDIYKNSLILIITSLMNAFFGFIFWIIAAKLYTKEDLGIASVLFSSITLIIILSRMGIDQTIIKYMPLHNKNAVFSTCMIVASILTLILGIGFLLTIDKIFIEYRFLKSNTTIYLIILLINLIFGLMSFVFIAIKQMKYNFFHNLIIGSRIIFLFAFMPLGYFGIFFSVGLSYLLAMAISAIILIRLGIHLSNIDVNFVKKSFNFSLGNYVADIFATAPNQLIPLIVYNIVGASDTAVYNLSYVMASMLFIIPSAFSMSLFVEGCHGENVTNLIKKSTLASFSLLLPMIFFLYVFADNIFILINETYLEGVVIFKIIILASFFVSICYNYFIIVKIKGDFRNLILFNGINSILLLIFTYSFVKTFGVIGTGYAWILSYGLCSCLILFHIIFKGGKIMKWIECRDPKTEYYSDIQIMSANKLHEQVSSILFEVKSKLSANYISVLDVAAGCGAFSKRMSDMGLNVDAVDLNEGDFKCHNLVQFSKIDINDYGQWNRFVKNNINKYDIVVSIETIEHLENPWRFLSGLKDVTQQGGFILLTIPNIECPISKALFVLTGKFLWFREADISASGHINPLTSFELVNICNKLGLITEEIYSAGNYPIFILKSNLIKSFGWNIINFLGTVFTNRRNMSSNKIFLIKKPKN